MAELEELGLPAPDDLNIDEARVVPTDDGGAVVEFGPEEAAPVEGGAFDENLVYRLNPMDQALIAGKIYDITQREERGRKKWRDSYVRGLKLLGLEYEKRNQPWADACGAFHPLLLESVIRFQAETMSNIFPPSGPTKIKEVGNTTPDYDRACRRVREDMNQFATKRIENFREETEMMVFNLPIAGTVFRKYRFDRRFQIPGADYVLPEHVTMPTTATSIHSSDFTHIIKKQRNEYESDVATGLYEEYDLSAGAIRTEETDKARKDAEGVDVQTEDMLDEFTFYERHIDWYFPWDEHNPDKLRVPYVVTIDRDSRKLLGVRRNWREGDPTFKRIRWMTQYKYMPGFGAYGMGLVHILGGLTEAATSLLRQLIDAGSLSNLPAGYKTKGLRIKNSDQPLKPGEFRDVDVGMGKMQDAFFPLPVKEPSQVLHALLGNVVDEGRRIGSVADLKVSDMSTQNMPVGSVLAIIERTMKVMAQVQTRQHNSMGEELELLSDIVNDFMPETEYDFPIDPRDKGVTRGQDYALCRTSMIPVSDPNAATQAMKIMIAQAIQQLAVQAPQIYNLVEVHRFMVTVLGAEDMVDRFIPMPEEVQPRDPVTENMDILNGRPVKAGVSQDHDSHIAVHMAMLEDPMLQAKLEANPQAPALVAAMYAHLQEHLAFQYRSEMEAKIGAPLPTPGEPLPEDVEYELSRLLAMGAGKVLDEHKEQKAQEEAEELAKDPVLQIERDKLKAQEDKTRKDFIAKMANIKVQNDKLKSTEKIAMFKEAAATERTALQAEVQTGAVATDAQIAAAEIAAKTNTETNKILVGAVTKKAELKSKERQAALKPKPKPQGSNGSD